MLLRNLYRFSVGLVFSPGPRHAHRSETVEKSAPGKTPNSASVSRDTLFDPSKRERGVTMSWVCRTCACSPSQIVFSAEFLPDPCYIDPNRSYFIPVCGGGGGGAFHLTRTSFVADPGNQTDWSGPSQFGSSTVRRARARPHARYTCSLYSGLFQHFFARLKEGRYFCIVYFLA